MPRAMVSVGFELLPQLVEGYKGALVAQAFKEAHFHHAAIKISFESEYVYLKSSFVSAHCGACAYICHSTEHRAIGQDGVDGKDSGRRKKERSCCRLYVRSRKAYCSAQLTSVDYNTLVKPLMPQKCFGMTNHMQRWRCAQPNCSRSCRLRAGEAILLRQKRRQVGQPWHGRCRYGC